MVDVNLVITDYCMPEMTGYDLLKKIKVFCLIFLLLLPFLFVCTPSVCTNASEGKFAFLMPKLECFPSGS